MDISQIRHFLAVADEGDWSRAANAAHVSRATIQASVAELEQLRGEQLVREIVAEGAEPGDSAGSADPGAKPRVELTAAGIAYRPAARAAVAKAPAPAAKAGGRAKASKGRGRAPVVKGEPKPFKKRQGR
ncbi:LysR family transcriptional regulator [Herbiconiux sp. CPCC 203407]|uniref:LysR family transcriptional regulator n=1 Tax=Herbiconiux oxytropis TaxID=2970915 RepID=A0AA41XCJ0_9MICO|nr:LysR family transcriptional regulator [Herbiconiux oxytropis]MCS5722142.1 LysR family transcriptional regulator [Herbiconiux oxytropis]MCS5725724.1 LysR family transcriptional regulator [Herbiconiux oxytropis]